MQLASRLMALPDASPVWQHAATLEPQACWMGMATTGVVRKGVGREEEELVAVTYGWVRSSS
jgi:hypothetical protein